jgi:hypothetical protein
MQCPRNDGTLNWASICEPGEQPLSGWLHRDCEPVFLGRHDDMIFRRPAAAMAAIKKQDEFLKRKFSPTGKSWFDIITECFDDADEDGGDDQNTKFSEAAE